MKQVAEQIAHCIRTCDLAFRFGGEEFVVLLGNTDDSGALLLAERIRQCIELMDNKHEGKRIKTSVSIGVTTCCTNDTEQSVFVRADKALYQAKENGRNRVCVN